DVKAHLSEFVLLSKAEYEELADKVRRSNYDWRMRNAKKFKGVCMKHVSVIAMALCLFSSTYATQHGEAKKPVKVFLLAGQSNMEGQGVVSMDHPRDYNGGKGNLVDIMKDPNNVHLYRHLKNEKGEWVVRDDVKITFRDRSGGLTIGYTGYGGTSHIGPELQFGHVVGDYYAEPVLLIKTAWGGKSLFKDFRPPSSGGTVGQFYKLMLEDIHKALDNMEENFPDLVSRGYEIAGFVWMQGWNDMCTPEAIPEYDKNLINLVKDLRKEFKSPNLPVIIGELGNGGPEAGGNMAAFRKAQKKGAEQIDNAAFVITHDFWRDPQKSPNVSHGHHWCGNAESYFLIGDALGKGIIKVIEAKDSKSKD
ncbi:MAG TPA: sialate O-acetylesterase, partial [Dehalococcoidales bacterium]|nr:sialate O-acetylesterase [Dehalococcoidales bacterium]